MLLARVGNSGAHIMETIGQGASEFEGHTASELRTALYLFPAALFSMWQVSLKFVDTKLLI